MKILLVVVLVMLLTACYQRAGGEEGDKEVVTLAERSQCSPVGNTARRPCQVSFYDLFGERFSGYYVVFVAYSPGAGVSLIFASKDSAEFEDYSSSIIVKGAGVPVDPGYVKVSGRFYRDDGDYGVGYPFSRQAGVIELTDSLIPMRSMSDRARECEEEGCYVEYLDFRGD